VERADRAPQALPQDHLEVRLEVTGPTSRRLTLAAHGPGAARLVAGLGLGP
jgi:hypothetical protein